MPEGFGGVVSVEIDGDADAAGTVCERTRVLTLAVEDWAELIADLGQALDGVRQP